jgi:hypothetical protein
MKRMARLRARFHFRLRGLLVDHKLLATRIETQRAGRTVAIAIPLRSVRLDAPTPTEVQLLDLFSSDDPPPTPTSVPLRAFATVASQSPIVQVDVIRIEVVADSCISAADVRNLSVRTAGPDGQALLSKLSDLLDELHQTARSVMSDFTTWARVQGRQHWLGIGEESPYGLAWADLVDLDANEVLPVDKYIAATGTIRFVEPRQVLRQEQVDQLRKVLVAPQRPSLPEDLLADASYYAGEANPPDRPRALLIAAVACEVKIKDTLRERVASAAAGLLELALRNTRPTVALFGKVCKEVTGRSLREDNRDLYNKLDDLFDRRNDLAHHGQAPTDAQVKESMQAAADVFRWLDALPVA